MNNVEHDSYTGSWYDGADFWAGFICCGIIGIARELGVYFGGGWIDQAQNTFWRGELSKVPVVSVVLGQAVATVAMASCAWVAARRLESPIKHPWYSVFATIGFIPRSVPAWSLPIFACAGFLIWRVLLKLNVNRRCKGATTVDIRSI